MYTKFKKGTNIIENILHIYIYITTDARNRTLNVCVGRCLIEATERGRRLRR